jgi:CheY-like chemotaxis protein
MNSVRDLSGKLERVLCVEDDEDIQRLIKIALERVSGIQVHACANPELAKGRAREVAPNLILLDYLMPALNGPAVFKLLQAEPDLARIPIVFLTGMVAGREAQELAALGPAGVISKPFNVLELPRKLARIWDGLKTAEFSRRLSPPS